MNQNDKQVWEIVKETIEETFSMAVEDDKNLDRSGRFNWDFVSADVFYDLGCQGFNIHAIQDDVQNHIDFCIDRYNEYLEGLQG